MGLNLQMRFFAKKLPFPQKNGSDTKETGCLKEQKQAAQKTLKKTIIKERERIKQAHSHAHTVIRKFTPFGNEPNRAMTELYPKTDRLATIL